MPRQRQGLSDGLCGLGACAGHARGAARSPAWRSGPSRACLRGGRPCGGPLLGCVAVACGGLPGSGVRDRSTVADSLCLANAANLTQSTADYALLTFVQRRSRGDKSLRKISRALAWPVSYGFPSSSWLSHGLPRTVS